MKNKFISLLLLLCFYQTALVFGQKAYDYLLLGKEYTVKGINDSATFYLEKAIDLSSIEPDTATHIKASEILAMQVLEGGDRDKALNLINESLIWAQSSKDTLLWSNVLVSKSWFYSSYGITNYSESLKFLQEAAELQKTINSWNTLAATYKNISSLFKEIGDPEKRELYLTQSSKLIEDGLITDLSVKAKILNELGRYYTDENCDYSKAEHYYTEVLDICKKTKWKKGIAVSTTNIAYIKEQQGDLNTALELHYQALELKKEINNIYGMINSYQSIGDILVKQQKYNEALQYLNKAQKLASDTKMINLESKIYESLYNTHKHMGNYSPALEFHEKYVLLTDSIKSVEQTKIVEELNTKYETKEKEQRIEELIYQQEVIKLKNQKETQRYLIILLILVISIISTIFLMHYRKIKSKANEAKLKQRLLRSQMNPHFIFNSLSSIQGFTYKNDTDSTARYLTNFSKLMRDILESSTVEVIPLEQELNIVENYLILQEMRKENLFDFKIEAPENTDEYIIPPMIAQPFIENSVIHAFKKIDYKGHIKVVYNVNDPFFQITIEDNGTGFNPNRHIDNGHKSMALELTQQRLKIFNYKKIRSNIEIINLDKEGGSGTRVVITLPLEKCLKF